MECPDITLQEQVLPPVLGAVILIPCVIVSKRALLMVGKNNLAGRSSVLYRDSLPLEMNASRSLPWSGYFSDLIFYCFPSRSRCSSMTASLISQICEIYSRLRVSEPLCSLSPPHKLPFNWLTLLYFSLCIRHHPELPV